MTTFTASSRTNIEPFLAMSIFDQAQARAASGKVVFHMEVGQPGTGAPPKAIEAVRRNLGSNVMGYTPAFGLMALREKLSAYYQTRYGATVSAEQIAITNGSSTGFVLSFLASFEPGARVGLTAPGYPAYRNILIALGYKPVLIEVGPQTRFQPTIALLQSHAPLDGLILASPGNPTGTMVEPKEFDALFNWCEANGCRMISDEIYHGLTWGQPEVTAASKANGHAVVVNSFSKYFSMTGWRVGWLVLPKDLVRPVEKLAQNMFICAPAVSQIAAIGALDDLEYLDGLRGGYRQKAAQVASGLALMGLKVPAATDGAFYAYCDVRSLTSSASAFAKRALDSAGVAIVPGLDFDPINGENFIRLSFAESAETVAGGMQALMGMSTPDPY